jgi:subtilisin family serine protease
MRTQWFRLFASMVVLAMLVSPFGAQTSLARDTVPGTSPAVTSGDDEAAENVIDGSTAAASTSGRVYNEAVGETESGVYIIQLADEPLATYKGGIVGLVATSPLATGARKLDAKSPASLAYEAYLADKQDAFVSGMNSLLGRSVDIRFYYRHAYNGVAAFLSPAEAARVAEMEGVVLLYRESFEELLTDTGPIFIGADSIWGGGFTDRAYGAALDGSQEVPPNGSAATGTGTFTYDLVTNLLAWHISHDVAAPTAAHIHSGAVGVNGPIEVPLDHTVNPMVGSATLTDAQQGMLANQLLYVNIHTAAFPGGEIRGQIVPTGTMGEGIIVGVIDTGINSGHPSFADIGDDGYDHTNPFGSGNYVGYCVANPSFCNDKLIGAWALHPSSTNPEDTNGHGSHTASTAAGNYLEDPILYAPTTDYTFASVSGVAPHANIIAYQVCVPSCPTSSTTAAVNQAVIDGVDVTNYSISGGTNPYVETTAVAFRNAAVAGVFPANSAGNSGPGAATVSHQGPWIMTVAASTHDRAILNSAVDLINSTGPLPDILGQSPTVGYGPAPLVYAGDLGNPLCNPFTPGTFSGEIVVCDRGVIGRVQKGANVLAAGGGGMILANDAPSAASLNDDPHVLPATHISYADGVTLKAWMAAGTNNMGRITGGVVDYDAMYGDNMASFSSRGPAGSVVPELANLVKPDVSAPGLNILAAYSAGSSTPPEFNIISGTSMSSPHAAGAAALIRALHPSWTPAEVKSALMMTGLTAMDKEDGVTPGDPFDFGAGRVNLMSAGNVGFVLDITEAEYLAANPAIGGDPRLLNLPSMADTECAGTCSWTRTLRSVLDVPATYNAIVDAPAGMTVTVTPSSFTINPGATQELVITAEIDLNVLPAGTWAFAQVNLEPVEAGVSAAHMPIAVIPSEVLEEPIIQVDPTSFEFAVPAGNQADDILTISNIGMSDLVWDIFEDASPASILVDWMDDFDSYATGSQLHGQGGWKGWDNNPAFGAIASDAQALSAPNSAAIVGLSDLVQEYTGYTSGGWVYTAWQYVPDDFAGTSYFIMLNTYNDGGPYNWSIQVNFNSATNLVTNDGVSGGTLPLVKGQWVELRVEIDLTADTQAFYYNNQLLYMGTWTGEVSGGGVLNIGAVDLFANNASVVYYDDLSLEGVAATCDMPDDIAWLSLAPTSGVTPAGMSDDVTVSVDTTGLEPGTYAAALCVTSNDPVTPLVVVPVTLEVLATAVIEVDPEELAASVVAGTQETLALDISNTGLVDLEWTIGEAEAAGAAAPGGNPERFLPDSLPDPDTLLRDYNAILADVILDGGFEAGTPNPFWDEGSTNFGTPLCTIASCGAGGGTGPHTGSWWAWFGGISALETGFVRQMVTLDAGAAELSFYLEIPAASGTGNDFLDVSLGGDVIFSVTDADASSYSTYTLVVLDVSAYAGGTHQLSFDSTVFGGGTTNFFVDDVALDSQPLAANVLYDNGPFITSFGDGPGGADVSLVQNISLGLTLLGANVSAPTFRIADDFTVTTPGGWTIDNAVFYGYQTGSGTDSTFTAVNFQIWDGPPDDPDSNVIFGDTVTNRMEATDWTNAYRYAESAPGTTRPVMYVVGEAGVHLDPGTYWLDWQMSGTVASGPWQPPITIIGETTTGDALQLTAAGWQALLDGGTSTPQGAPFQLWGTTVCDNQSDVSWLSVDPASGTTAPGTTTSVDVTLDATGLEPGDYIGYLCITSNDPLNPVVTVPVTMTVVPVEYGVELAPAADAQTGAPGETVEYTLMLTNTGNATDTFDVTFAGNAWDVHLPETEFMLGAGESTAVVVHVTIPMDAEDGDMDAVTVTATSQGDMNTSASSVLTTTAEVEPPPPPEGFILYLPIVNKAFTP